MIAGLLALLGCGPSVDCEEPGAVLAEAGGTALTCSRALQVPRYLERLAGRPMAHGDEGLALAAVADRFLQDPAATGAWLDAVGASSQALAGLRGLVLAEARAERVWEAQAGAGHVRPDMGTLWNVQGRALSVWAKDDEEKLAVTEADLEAWIRYASLCREVQGGTVLRISVADRVTVYQVLIDRFTAADRATQVALAALGPHWSQISQAWKAAGYDTQRAWVADAPLPPPMTATSLGYAEAVFAGDLPRHAAVVHAHLGPFGLPE